MRDHLYNPSRTVHAWWRASLELCLFAAATLLLPLACSRRDPPNMYAVVGTLLVDGSPAANASVAFHPLQPSSNPRFPVGRTDKDGRFHLTTNSVCEGAPPGDYAVTVVWLDETIPFDECECDNPLIHDRLKGYYAHADLTELRATVNRSDNSFCFHTRRPPGEGSPFSSKPEDNRSREIRRGSVVAGR